MIGLLNKVHIAIAILMLALWSCDRHSGSSGQSLVDYTVICKLDKKVARDLATLYVVDNTLMRKRMLSVSGQSGGMFTFKGQIESPHVAIIKFDGEKRPFYFVLEQGTTNIEFSANKVIVTGGAQNHAYFSFINQVKWLQNQRKNNFKAYLKAAKDSTLTERAEKRFAITDQRLNDSIQALCLDCMNAGNSASLIIRERYVNLLDCENAAKLTK